MFSAIFERSNLSFLLIGILAKSENAEAMSESVSICSIIDSEKIFTLSLTRAPSVFKLLSKSWTLSFIGVNGFFISWATCFAISFQALSFSFCAKMSALFSSSFTIKLYWRTNWPISSLESQLRGMNFFIIAASRMVSDSRLIGPEIWRDKTSARRFALIKRKI